MSDLVLAEYKRDREVQLTRNEARRIRTRVNDARSDNSGADLRWPFEVTQNAHDPGIRDGQTSVNLRLFLDGTTFLFEHDGKPFTTRDLAALLSGGSSKDFESEEMTGRFGTGFLVTHALSLEIELNGILASGDGHTERFGLKLDRSGDEDRIVQNTIQSYESIRAATPVVIEDGRPTASFRYPLDNSVVARAGIEAFAETALYLFGTCEHLGTIQLSDAAIGQTTWQPVEHSVADVEHAVVKDRRIAVERTGSPRADFRVVRFESKEVPHAAIVFLLSGHDDAWRFEAPPATLSRFFSRFPIRGGVFLPLNVVIDGQFDVSQERDRIHMRDGDKAQIAAAIELLPAAIRWARGAGIHGAHGLGRMAMPKRSFNSLLTPADKTWWMNTLANVAQTIAAMPVVQTRNGDLPAVVSDDQPEGVHADFILPRFELDSGDELDQTRVWALAMRTNDVDPPVSELTQEWSLIALGWASLGVPIHAVTLTELATKATSGAKYLMDLAVIGDAREWLLEFFDLVGIIAKHHDWPAVLSGLIPNQNGLLRSPTDNLRRDTDLSPELKDLAKDLGHDIRRDLLDREFERLTAAPARAHAANLLHLAVPNELTEDAVLNSCLSELTAQLPAGKAIPPEKAALQAGAIQFLIYVWDRRQGDGAALAQQCPLITAEGTAARWDHQKKIMAPAKAWPASAVQFSDVYPSARVLSDQYVLPGDNFRLVSALVAWDIAIPEPLSFDLPRELKPPRLAAIAADAAAAEAVTVSKERFSQIALLPSEVIQRCAGDLELTRRLLGLVLCHIAPNDPAWREIHLMKGRRGTEDVELAVVPALWLADLKSRALVPMEAESGVEQVIANAGNLRNFLDANWLTANDAAVELLVNWFGFNALELRILSMGLDDQARARLEQGLAKVVQAVGDDAAEYEVLAQELADRRKREEEKEHNRRFGLAVQHAIEKYLGESGLDLQLIDNGYDYDVFLDGLPSLEAGTHHFRLGDYLLEIKATTSGEVRLTPPQAITAAAEPDRFVLCVVDLRGVAYERLEGDWQPSDVEPLARILTGVGRLTRETCELIEMASEEDVAIRNQGALRYGVKADTWGGGISIRDWVTGVARTAL